MITNEWLYWLIGAFFIAVSILIATNPKHDKKALSSIFWGLLGVSFMYGTFVQAKTAPAWILGVTVLVMALIAGFNGLGVAVEKTTSVEERAALAQRFGNKLFIPALTVPLVTVIVAVLGPKLKVDGEPLLAEGSATLTGLGIGAIVGLIVVFIVLRPKSPSVPLSEGTRLLEAIGWAALLPQMLSTLGTLFTKAGVGTAVADVIGAVIPQDALLWSVIAYCLGNALFTVVMGNAFAAFPIMTAAIGWPVLVENFDGNPAAIFAMGMLAGFCGTLCTPMAANFNIVPAALLQMKNKYGPIIAQIPTAIIMLVVITIMMRVFAF